MLTTTLPNRAPQHRPFDAREYDRTPVCSR